MTPELRPMVARTKENSPTCASPSPVMSETRREWPSTTLTPAVIAAFPATSAATPTAIFQGAINNVRPSNSIPTETKKMPRKACRSGRISPRAW